MGINFPNAPTIGQLHPQPAVAGVAVYRWDGQTWVTGSADIVGAVRYDAAQTLTAAQKAQARSNIDALKKNYIVNGAMQISQENGATAITTAGYPVDQFTTAGGASGAYSAQQVASPTPAGSPNRLRITITTADASVAAGDIFWIENKIEGLRVADLRYGSTVAKTTILQFGVKAPAGTYSVVFLNSATTRSYVAEYVIAAGEANTDAVKSVTIPGDTLGAWLSDTGIGISIRWGLMAGTTYQQAAGSWAATNMIGSLNQFNFMGTINNVFELFDIGLYEGAVAPAFQVPDYVSELALCRRYYWKWNASFVGEEFCMGHTQSTTTPVGQVRYPVTMRAIPAVLALGGAWQFNQTGVGIAMSSLNAAAAGLDTCQIYGTTTALVLNSPGRIQGAAGANFSASARL